MPRKRKKAEILGLTPNPPEKKAAPSRIILGSSKLQPDHRLTLIKNVREKLNAKIGDTLIFTEDKKGNLTIKIIETQQKKKPKHT